MSEAEAKQPLMKLSDLTQEIEAYASAKASGNPVLVQRQGFILQNLLRSLPEELPTKEQMQE